jgi:hypothetical protein
MDACFKGRFPVVDLLVRESGADVNAKDNDGETALMSACKKGHVKVVGWLVRESNELNVDVNAVDKNGNTALMLAAINGHVGVVQLLVTIGADVNAEDKNGNTALELTQNRIDEGTHNGDISARLKEVVRLLTPVGEK